MQGKVNNPRVVCWYSCGATSAIASQLAIREFGKDHEVVVAYCDTGSEHPDNMRFLKDCERLYGQKIEILHHHKYKDIWEVFEARKYLKRPEGAPCTLHLKREIRKKYQRPDDIQVFGYTLDEAHRVTRFRQENPGVDIELPLFRAQLSSGDCKELLVRQGIALPAMYLPQKSGVPYGHNNCIGCVKGRAGYWNKIRVDFPDVFARMALLERKFGYALCLITKNGKQEPCFLDELPPNAGRYEKEEKISCDVLCSMGFENYNGGK